MFTKTFLDIMNDYPIEGYTITSTFIGCDWGIDKSRNFFTWKYNEETKKYGSKIALPGVSKEQLNIKQIDDTIYIKLIEKTDLYDSEKEWGLFVPYNADMKTFNATMKDGILTLEVERKVKEKEFKIN